MKKENRTLLEGLEKSRRGRAWRRAIALLSIVTVLLTVYWLSKPVEAREHVPTCGLEEHVHDDSCFDGNGEIICGMQAHAHTDACYQQNPILEGRVDEDVEELESFEIGGDNPGEAAPDQEPADADVPAADEGGARDYIYDFRGNGVASLGDILSSTKMDIGDVAEVGECMYTEHQAQSIRVEMVDGKCLVKPVRNFVGDDVAELGIITGDGEIYVVALKNGVVEAAEPDHEENDGANAPEAENKSADEAPAADTASVQGEAVEPAAEPDRQGGAEAVESADSAVEPAQGEAVEPAAEPVSERDGAKVVEPADSAAEPEQGEAVEPADEPVQGETEEIAAASRQEESGDPTDADSESKKDGESEETELMEEEPTDEEPTDEEPTDEEPTDEEQADEEPTDEEPTDEAPTDEEPADDGAKAGKAVRTYAAEIDLTNVEAPLSLARMMAVAEPVGEEPEPVVEAPAPEESAGEAVVDDAGAEAGEAAEAPRDEAPAEADEAGEPPITAADWQLTYDEALFDVAFDGEDYLFTPTASFEAATIRVEADGSYVLNLTNYTLPVAYPAQTFEGHTGSAAVRVSAPEGAFPEGTVMAVADVEDESVLGGIADAVEQDNTAVKRVHAVDITFRNAAGEEIEPLIPISVVITVDEVDRREDAVVVHVDDEGNAEKVETTDVSADEVAFDAEAFSVYAVVVTEHYITADGHHYAIKVTYGPDAGIPEDAALAVTEILQDDSAYDKSYDEYVASAEDALGHRAGSADYIRLFDIKIVDANDPTLVYQPAEGTTVDVSIELADARKESLGVVHFAEGSDAGDVVAAETVAAGAEGKAVRFEADGFSIYAVAGFSLEKIIQAGDGQTYRITLTFTEDALLPDDARLEIEELAGEACADYVGRSAAAMNAGGFQYARAFDISIVDGDGNKVQPAVPVEVSIELMDAAEGAEAFSVVHFAGEAEAAEQMAARTTENTVSFSADSFSVYAIVAGPSAIPERWHRLSGMAELEALGSQGLYIGHEKGYYFADGTVTDDKNRTGIAKTRPAQSYPCAEASKYFFEKVDGTENQYYAWCMDGEERKYVYNGGDNSLSFTGEAGRTAFTVVADQQGRFRLYNDAWYWNMQGGENGNRFCAYNKPADGNNYMYIWSADETIDEPYGLDGAEYGLVSWTGGVTGKALMSSGSNGSFEAKQLLVLTKENDREEKLVVPMNVDDGIATWTFHWIGDDLYRLSTKVDGAVRYLVMRADGLSLAENEGEATQLQVVPGTGAHAGEICLKAGKNTLTYSGVAADGFVVNGAVGGEWLHCAELSNNLADYYRTYTASKVSVSDPGIKTGSKIVVYTRAWNEERKRYDFFALDNDGTLVRCYESGDSIEWVGGVTNTMLWQLTEYTDDDGNPTNYYELYNPSSQMYIAPQITGNQILSPEPIGIILDGRINKRYYSPVYAWDQPDYSYAGMKVEDGRVVTCPRDDAMDFYFAVMDDIPVDDVLHTVKTLDNNQHGITMKLIDKGTRLEMSNFLGSNDYEGAAAISRRTVPGLLSTELGDDGYPTTKGGSLAKMYEGAATVNHLFIESVYNGTGYYHFDSTQNFASLHGSDFVVYKELGSYDNDNKGRETFRHGQFFPFNDLQPGLFTSVNRLNTYDPNTGKDFPDSDPRKYERLYLIQDVNTYFAMEMEASFIQTANGLDAWGHDIIFEFSGDDDFWLYVDGELVIDLGGIHSAVPGSVNFRTGDVYVNDVHTTLYDLFYQNYKGRGHTDEEARAYADGLFPVNSEGNRVFKTDTWHTMRIFYMERGASASNLNVRFNLASTKTGTVQLTKKLKNVDSSESCFAEFPYQILYKAADGTEKYLSNAVPRETVAEEYKDYVFYKDSLKPVKYIKEGFEIDGVAYPHVFFLKPDEVAEIHFPEGTTEYKIVECGVNTEVYERVTANGEELEGSVPEGGNPLRKDFGIDYAAIGRRPKVTYENEVGEKQILTIRKRLFDANGNEIELYDDAGNVLDPDDKDLQRTFEFRLSLGTEFDGGADTPARIYRYHVKNPAGVYCAWDKNRQVFVPITHAGQGISSFDDLNPAEVKKATFETSLNGAIDMIPAYYTVEIRELLVGTRFKVVERPAETPEGYRFWKYRLNDKDCGFDVSAGASGQIQASEPSRVEVCNWKGYALRLYKDWSDADYVTDRDPAHFAVFFRGGDGTLKLVDGTVRELPYADPSQSLYWFFPSLTEGSFDRYDVYEVTLTGNYTVSGDGSVTGYTDVTPVQHGNGLEMGIVRRGFTSRTRIDYRVTYEAPECIGDNYRIFRASNTSKARPRIVLRKQDWDGHPLKGAEFTLALVGGDGDSVKTYTSDAGGLITIAYPEPGASYILTETKSPAGYCGLKQPLTFKVDVTLENGELREDVTVTPDSGEITKYYLVDEEEGIPCLIVKDKPYALEVVKVDAATGAPLADAVFSLHKQVTIDGLTSYLQAPMEGYGELRTDENGVIPRLDNTLPAGTYKLKEESAPAGYIQPVATDDSRDVHFSVSDMGEITQVGQLPEGARLVRSEQEDVVRYTLAVPNTRKFQVSIWKTGLEYNPLTGAEFALYRLEDYDDDSEQPKQDAEPILTGEVGENSIMPLGPLGIGHYRLVELTAPAGYVRLEHAIRICVEAESVSAMQDSKQSEISVSGNAHWVEGQDDDTVQIHVWNNPGATLPSTGGSGTALFRVSGIALMLAALLLLLRRRIRTCTPPSARAR